MLYYFLYPLHAKHTFFNVFKYITFRTFGATITSVLLCMLIGPAYIRFLQRKQMGQFVREDGPKSHLTKKGTPTMGGGLILIAIVLPTMLWSDLSNKNIWVAMIATVLFGVVGYIDDYRKVVKKELPRPVGQAKAHFSDAHRLCCSLFYLFYERYPARIEVPLFQGLVPLFRPSLCSFCGFRHCGGV